MKKCSRSKAHLALRAVYIVFQVLDDAALQNRMLLNTFEGGEVGQSGMMVGQRLPIDGGPEVDQGGMIEGTLQKVWRHSVTVVASTR